jgi:hypothetical protein
MLHVAQIPSDDCTAVEVRLVGERSGREPLGVQCFRSNGQVNEFNGDFASVETIAYRSGHSDNFLFADELDRNNLCSTDASQIRFQLAEMINTGRLAFVDHRVVVVIPPIEPIVLQGRELIETFALRRPGGRTPLEIPFARRGGI